MSSPDKPSVNWPLVVVFGCFWCLQWLNTDVFFAAIRTRIQCGETGMDTEFCAEHNGACVPYPPSDTAHWSGSLHCYDKNYVLLEQAKRGSKISGVSNTVMFLMMPFLGTIADNFGRKKVLVISFLGMMINATLMTLAFEGPLSQSFLWMCLAGGFGALLTGGFNGSALAMAADRSGNTVEDRAPAIAYLARARAVATCLAFTLGFVVLFQNMTDYGWVFITFIFLSLSFLFLACFLLEESLPAATSQDSLMKRRSSVSQNFVNGCEVLYADKFLLGLFVVVFLNYIAFYGALQTLVGFLLASFQYSQAVASLGGIFIQPFIFSGTLLATNLMKRVRPFRTYATGVTFSLLAFALQGVCMCFDNLVVSQLVWWCGFCLAGAGLGITDTTAWTIVSMRVSKEHQSKIQGLVQQSQMAGTAIGTFVWGNLLFDPSGVGLAAGKCFLCSSAVYSIALILFMTLWMVTGTKDAADEDGSEWKLLQ